MKVKYNPIIQVNNLLLDHFKNIICSIFYNYYPFNFYINTNYNKYLTFIYF